MLLDAGGLSEGDRLETDLCIVGAGPAGITIARELAGGDLRVCVLESGGLRSSVRTHRLTGGRNAGESYHRLLISRDRGLGGSSLRFPLDVGWHVRPLDPIDFERRHAVPHSGWPITRDDLDPFYVRAQEISDVGPYTYDPADWESPELGTRLPLDPGVVETNVFQLAVTNFGRFRTELEQAPNVRVILRATVVDLVTDENPCRVDRLVVARPDGARFTVDARLVVVACGGIDNARLLLASNRTHTRGLGNQHDLVGRFFMERLSTRSGWIDPASPDVVDAARFYVNKPSPPIRIEGVLRLNESLMRAEGLRNCLFYVLPRSRAYMSAAVWSAGIVAKSWRRQPLPAGFGRHVRQAVRGVGDLGRVALEKGRGVAAEDRVLLLRAQAEQAPNPASRVTLGRRRDPLGCRRAQLEWRTTADDRDSIRRSQELVGEAFRAAGLGVSMHRFGDEDPPALFEGNWHHLGTTRMSDDPRTGVVDADGRVHGMENLFVAGSSVFPTAGASNPTLTIVALALRLARHLERVVAPSARRRSAPDALIDLTESSGADAAASSVTGSWQSGTGARRAATSRDST